MRRLVYIIITLTVILAIYGVRNDSTVRAYPTDTRNYYGISNELFEIWLKADSNYSKPIALQLADSMYRLAVQQDDKRAQCLALAIPIDYYNSQPKVNLMEMKKAVDRQRDFALSTKDCANFAFFPWAKLIQRFINNYDYSAALYELDAYRKAAESNQNSYGLFSSSILYSQIYTAIGQDSIALKYAYEGIDFIRKYGHNPQSYKVYNSIAATFIERNQPDSALFYLDIIESDASIPTDGILMALYLKSKAMLKKHELNGYDEIVSQYKDLLPQQHYSHEYYASHYHEMMAYSYLYHNLWKEALQHSDSVRDIGDRLALQYQIYEHSGQWKEAYQTIVVIDSLQLTDNISRMQRHTEQQDSLLKENNVANAQRQLELEQAQQQLEQARLEQFNNDMKLRQATSNRLLRQQEEKAESLNLLHSKIELEKKRAATAQSKAEMKEVQASKEALKQRRHRDTLYLTSALITFVVLSVAATLYVSSRQLIIEAKEKELATAQQTDLEKTTTIQNIRHEIRTPLNSIIGFADLLASANELDLSEDERKEYIQYILHNTSILQSTINNMINLSQMENGTNTPTLADTPLMPLAETAFHNAEHNKPEKVEFINNINDPTIHITTDPAQLLQVISNLIGNACKYTKEGSIKLTFNDRGTHYEFSVADTGVGIPKDKAEKVFKRFEKLGSQVQGSGLGLNICRSILNTLGGEIHVDVLYTAGCRMVFTLPKNA